MEGASSNVANASPFTDRSGVGTFSWPGSYRTGRWLQQGDKVNRQKQANFFIVKPQTLCHIQPKINLLRVCSCCSFFSLPDSNVSTSTTSRLESASGIGRCPGGEGAREFYVWPRGGGGFVVAGVAAHAEEDTERVGARIAITVVGSRGKKG